MIKKICIVGMGYVGLPTALAFADAGYSVVGTDIKEELINKLNGGTSTIPEILSDKDIQKNLGSKLSFTTDTPKAVQESDAILITVPTPVDENKKPDLRAVKSAAKAVAEGMRKNKLVVLESTVYPGVTEEIVQKIIEEKTQMHAGVDFGLAYCPERYNPGDTDHTIETMQRVLGAINDHWLQVASEMYSKITKAGVYEVTNIKTAEAAKVIENTQRDLNIGLMNELALIFDKVGVDTREVIRAASTKWNFHVYFPGPGVGGHCFDKDEYLFINDGTGLQTCKISEFIDKELNNGWEKKTFSNGGSLVFPKGLETLSFDLDAKTPKYKEITALSKRRYSGKILKITMGGGRILKVTDRHPMVSYDGAFEIKEAKDLVVGDHIPIAINLPDSQEEFVIDLIEKLTDEQIQKTRVKPKKKRFKDYKEILSKRSSIGLSDFGDYYRNNSMPLSIYLELERQGKMPIDHKDVFLCTGRGPSYNQLSGVIKLNEDFARLLGYYLSEGCITKDKSLRTRFTFHTKEKEYINDLKNILKTLGVKHSSYTSKHSAAYHIKVSSNLFGYLIKDVLRCGIDCHTMTIPQIIFMSPRSVRRGLLSGLLRGDSGVYYVQNKRTYSKKGKEYTHNSNCATVSYYSSSTVLHQQAILLLQSFGFIPTLKPGTPHIRVHGRDAERMAGLFDGEKKQKLEEYSGRKIKYSQSKTFKKHGDFATTTIQKIEEEPAGTVFSLEVDGTSTVVTTNGIITHNCLPVDPYYLVEKARDLGYDPKIITAGREVNDYMATHVVNLAERLIGNLNGKKITILGSSYKGNVGDARETPAKRICAELKVRGAGVFVYDPLVDPKDMAGWGVEVADFDTAITGSDCIVIHTDHEEFKKLDLLKLSDKMKTPAIVDTRAIVDPIEASKTGFLLARI